MVTCCAIGCTNRSSRASEKKPGVSFHHFPVNPVRRMQWILAVRRKDWKPNKYSRICSDHFVEEDFNRTLGRVQLRETAIPSVFKGFPSYLQKKNTQRTTSASSQGSLLPSKTFSNEHSYSSALPEAIKEFTEEPSNYILPVVTSEVIQHPSNSVFPIAINEVTKQSSNSLSPVVTSKVTEEASNYILPVTIYKVIKHPSNYILPVAINEVTKQSSNSSLPVVTSKVTEEASNYILPVAINEVNKQSSNSSLPVVTSKVSEVACNYILPVVMSDVIQQPSDSVLPEALSRNEIQQPPSNSVSQTKEYYKWKCKFLTEKCKKLERQLKNLRTSNRRKLKKQDNLNKVFSETKKNNLINDEDLAQLIRSSEADNDLFQQLCKKNSRKIPAKLRAFALNLHCYSSPAYRFVRESFKTSLPHPKTMLSWYKSIHFEPGFAKESLACLKLKSEENPKPICSLIVDEIAITKADCFDGNTCHGYVTFGSANDDTLLAKEALVFMVVAINYNWKIPIGYFFLHEINSSQKSNLVKQCLKLIHSTGIEIVSLTFEGFSTKFTTATNLGCDFSDVTNLKTTFKHPVSNDTIAVMLDPCHLLKLVKNCLMEKKAFFDDENKAIDWWYVTELQSVQSKEGLCLGTKTSNIFFHKQTMKVSLVSQVFSDSVADSIEFCDKYLRIKSFQGCDSTVRFIRILSQLFDIFNSKSVMQLPHKRAIDDENIEPIVEFLRYADCYLEGLRVRCSDLPQHRLLNSNRGRGFLGLKICISSVLHLLNLLQNKSLLCIPIYKFSKIHLELFFSSIRSMSGTFNPNAKQFKLAYSKLLTHSEFGEGQNGNCIPLEQVSLLNSRSTKSPLIIINETADHNRLEDDYNLHKTNTQDLQDDTCVLNPADLAEFIDECIDYISGSIVQRLTSQLKCETCLNALLIETKPDDLIPKPLFLQSQDVVEICKKCEFIFRTNIFTYKRNLNEFHTNALTYEKLNVLKFSSAVLELFINKNVFDSLNDHIRDMSPMDNHRTHLIREIAHRFYQIRIRHSVKKQIPSDHSFYT